MGDCHIPWRKKISLVYNGINNRFQIQVKTIINKPNKVKKMGSATAVPAVRLSNLERFFGKTILMLDLEQKHKFEMGER